MNEEYSVTMIYIIIILIDFKSLNLSMLYGCFVEEWTFYPVYDIPLNPFIWISFYSFGCTCYFLWCY